MLAEKKMFFSVRSPGKYIKFSVSLCHFEYMALHPGFGVRFFWPSWDMSGHPCVVTGVQNGAVQFVHFLVAGMVGRKSGAPCKTNKASFA